MRKAAGIILIVIGVLGVTGAVMGLTDIYVELVRHLHVVLWRIGSGAFLIVGGVFCLRRRYWRACLISALFALFIGLFSTIDYVRHLETGVTPFTGVSLTWGFWIVLVAGVISTTLICVKRKEWQEISDSVDGEVSYVG
jgi:hypothetical protein